MSFADWLFRRGRHAPSFPTEPQFESTTGAPPPGALQPPAGNADGFTVASQEADEADEATTVTSGFRGAPFYVYGPQRLYTWEPWPSSEMPLEISAETRAVIARLFDERDRDGILRLRYGRVDASRWMAWRSVGVELHVLSGGADRTRQCRWFDDTDRRWSGARTEGLFYREEDDGRRTIDPRSGQPRVALQSDVVVVPLICDPGRSGPAAPPLTPEAVRWWTGEDLRGEMTLAQVVPPQRWGEPPLAPPAPDALVAEPEFHDRRALDLGEKL